MNDTVFAALKESGELALIVGLLYFALTWSARLLRREWRKPVGQVRILVLFLLTLAVTAIKVADDVVSGETGFVDEAILRFIRDHIPREMDGFFKFVTFTGSGWFLHPLVLVWSAMLLAARKSFETLLFIISAAIGTLVITLAKAAVGRPRPALWETDWYHGSSFPSGHTLQTAVVASALVIYLARTRPRLVRWIAPLATAWIFLVALSRLVLGVHWPSDVLAAACLGVMIPFIVHFILQRWGPRSAPRPDSPPER